MGKQFSSELKFEEATIHILKPYFKEWSWQVPSWNRVIDFAGITHKNQTIGIEYKLRDWKKAIEQACAHKLEYDFVYILMPRISLKAMLDAEKRGVGVLRFKNQTITVLLKPKRNQIWEPAYKKAKQYIRHFQIHERNIDSESLKELARNYNSILEAP